MDCCLLERKKKSSRNCSRNTAWLGKDRFGTARRGESGTGTARNKVRLGEVLLGVARNLELQGEVRLGMVRQGTARLGQGKKYGYHTPVC